jgi:hypothetical protein
LFLSGAPGEMCKWMGLIGKCRFQNGEFVEAGKGD